jgi:predicted adenylyl cyclase CyaB
MARNVEIKARVPSRGALLSRAIDIADDGPTEIAQDDTFFACATGRLKLRQFSTDSAELIFYRRADQAGPKESFYVRSATSEPGSLREALTLAYGQAGRVIKQRTLFLVGRTRIHVDKVQGLGDFVEIEVVLRDDEPVEAGVQEAREIMRSLGIDDADLVTTAYVDLLNTKGL